MNRLPNLTDEELHSTLLNALRCAADKYRDNAKALREYGKDFPAIRVTHDGLVDQFERQASRADALADRLEEESEDA